VGVGQVRLAVVVEPVGENELRRRLIRRVEHGLEQRLSLVAHGRPPSALWPMPGWTPREPGRYVHLDPPAADNGAGEGISPASTRRYSVNPGTRAPSGAVHAPRVRITSSASTVTVRPASRASCSSSSSTPGENTRDRSSPRGAAQPKARHPSHSSAEDS